MARVHAGMVGIVAMVLALAAGLVWMTFQLRQLAEDQQKLLKRMKSAENTAAQPRIEEGAASAQQIPPSTDADVAALAIEVDELKKQMQDLLSALEITTGPQGEGKEGPRVVLATHPTAASGSASTPVGGDGAPQSADGKSLSDILGLGQDDQDRFKNAVLKVIDDQKQEEARKQAIAQRQKMLAEMAKNVGLNPYQLDEIKRAVEAGVAQENNLRRQMSDANKGQIQKDIQGVMSNMDSTVRSDLTVEQVAKYNAWRNTPIAKSFFGPPPPQPGARK